MAWQNRAQFFALASQMMRRVLVDHARSRQAGKRPGRWARIELDEAVAATEQRNIDLVFLDRALEDLSALDPRQGRLIELRFFGGLSLEETAEVLGVSLATAKRDWTHARAWLYRRIKGGSSGGGHGPPEA